jgi:hypothetical protein
MEKKLFSPNRRSTGASALGYYQEITRSSNLDYNEPHFPSPAGANQGS